MSAGSDARDSIVTIEHLGRRRALGASELPLTVGGDAGVGFHIDGLPGAIGIDRLGGAFFVEAGRAARNLRLGGVPVAGTRELKDGDVIAFDRARLTCRIADDRLDLRVDVLVTAGDTAPPDSLYM
jgi:hypothetical protein